MKTYLKSLLVLMLSFAGITLIAQNDCKVLMPQIDSSYTGGCKKGLAHGKGVATGVDKYEGHFRKGLPEGKGTYTWSTGEVYTGEWKAGERDGEGILTVIVNGEKVKTEGIWKHDKYKGKKPVQPKINQRINVDRYNFRLTGDHSDRVLIDLYQNGMKNNDVEDYMIVSDSGYETSLGNMKGIEQVTFPVTIKVTYRTWDKMHTQKLNVIFDFTIFEPGDWLVEITN